MATKTTNLMILVEPEIKKRLKMVAVSHGLSMTDIVLKGVLKELEQLEKQSA